VKCCFVFFEKSTVYREPRLIALRFSLWEGINMLEATILEATILEQIVQLLGDMAILLDQPRSLCA